MNEIMSIIQYASQFVQWSADIACMYYIEIPQEVTNENKVTLVYYLAQQKYVIPHVILQMAN